MSGELGRKSRRRARATGDAAPTYTFALPLLRRPAFPGFYQVIQVALAGGREEVRVGAFAELRQTSSSPTPFVLL